MTDTITAADLTTQVERATDASDGTYDVPAIVADILDTHGAIDIDTLDHAEFWGIVAAHATDR